MSRNNQDNDDWALGIWGKDLGWGLSSMLKKKKEKPGDQWIFIMDTTAYQSACENDFDKEFK